MGAVSSHLRRATGTLISYAYGNIFDVVEYLVLPFSWSFMMRCVAIMSRVDADCYPLETHDIEVKTSRN